MNLTPSLCRTFDSRTLREAVTDSILIAAAFAQRPGYGGHAWALLQYVLGFRALGFDVTVVDRLEQGMAPDERAALGSVGKLLGDEGIPFCVFGDDGASRAGLTRAEVLARAAEARLLLNVMGFVRDPELLAAARRRVFLDIDPGFGQVWRELGLADLFAGHDDFVTVGRNIGRDGCGVPTCGLRWLTIPHPVVLERCPVAADGNGAGFTSVGSWRGPYDRIEYDGQSLGLRVHEFRKFIGLPTRVDADFRVALEIDPSDEADLASLRENGWQLVDPREAAGDPAQYLRFVQSSLAEFTVAKGMYVALQSGWLGDRTVCYLASGKPALVQDTGLGAHYPLGEGLLAFSTIDDAVEGARAILADPGTHTRAARRLAEQELDSRIVLARLLEELGT
jgi:hypothetical protein